MKRRNFLGTSTAAVAGASASTAFSENERPPNLLIVHCDELNFRTLGCYRDTLSPEQAMMWGPGNVVETPHIDRLAREGCLSTKMYAATPVCSPSRSTFLSGQYAQNTGVTTNSLHLSDEVVTFAHQLGKAGYETGYAGKWHLDGIAKPGWAPERQFGFQDNRYMFNRGHWKQFEETPDGPRVKARDAKDKPTYSVKGADEESFATDWLTTKAIEFIDQHGASPFCYMLSIPDPHGPDTVRAPYDRMFLEMEFEAPRTYHKPKQGVPSWATPAKNCGLAQAQYFGMMKCIDENLGRLFAKLEAEDLLDDTILIFTADHGDMRAEHHRQNKGIPLEASAKIPFLVRYPKKIAAGKRVDQAWSTADFSPTILSLMGIDPSGREEGRDASALFVGEDASWDDIAFVRSTGRLGGEEGWISAMTSRYKLVLADDDEPWLLDLKEDPDELKNFLSAKPDVARELALKLKDYAEAFSDPYLNHPETSKALAGILA